MEDKDNKRATTLLNLIADFRIANEQLISKNNDLRMELLAKNEKIGNTLQELREVEGKVRLASAKLEYLLAKFGLAENMKIEREDIQEIFDILTKKGDK